MVQVVWRDADAGVGDLQGDEAARTRLDAAAAFVGAAILTAPQADAITYGEPDCADLSENIDCLHTNTVSLSGFRRPAPGEETDSYISFLRCSGSLLSKDTDRFVILTAGHCASAYLSGLQDGSLVDVGVSFDAKIEKDLPQISPTVWSPRQYILGGQPVLPVEYGPQGAKASNIQFDYAVIVFDVVAAQRFTEGGDLVDLTNKTFVIRSAGPDGKRETTDDISVDNEGLDSLQADDRFESVQTLSTKGYEG